MCTKRYLQLLTAVLLPVTLFVLGRKVARWEAPAVLASAVDDAADLDGDGVPDAWENGGVEVTVASGAKQWLDLKADGASSDHRDVFVWVAWMEGNGHSHKPTPGAIQIVKDAFNNAPAQNPDGHNGIRLHVFFSDQPMPETPTIGAVVNGNQYVWDDFQKIKDAQFPKELLGKFHFCLFAHELGNLGTTSGISRDIPSYDFIVSLGGFQPNSVGTTQDQAGTFMHELGHNLGLRHGGIDDANNKPNYLSSPWQKSRQARRPVPHVAQMIDSLLWNRPPGRLLACHFRDSQTSATGC